MASEKAGIRQLIRENKKVLFFLLRFLGAFGGLSLVYAFWVDSFGDKADTFSWFVGRNLQLLFGAENLKLEQILWHPAIAVDYNGSSAVSLIEGCNGLAVMILFFAFVFAFKGNWKDLLWFVPLGLGIIHLFNLGRLALLIYLAHGNSPLFHFMHKYLFTLIIYAAVFGLWVVWVKKAGGRGQRAGGKELGAESEKKVEEG